MDPKQTTTDTNTSAMGTPADTMTSQTPSAVAGNPSAVNSAPAMPGMDATMPSTPNMTDTPVAEPAMTTPSPVMESPSTGMNDVTAQVAPMADEPLVVGPTASADTAVLPNEPVRADSASTVQQPTPNTDTTV